MINKVFKPKILKYLFVGICTVAIDYLAIFVIYSFSALTQIHLAISILSYISCFILSILDASFTF